MPKWTMQSTAQDAEASAIQGRHVEAAPLCSVPGPCRLLAIFSTEARSLDWAFLRILTKDWSPLEGLHIILCARESRLLLSKLVGLKACRLLPRVNLADRQCNAVKEHQKTEHSSASMHSVQGDRYDGLDRILLTIHDMEGILRKYS